MAAGLALASSACACTADAAASCPPSPFVQDRMLVIAHAGGEGLGPANTIEAMELAVAAGADVLDIDVRATADGELVAIHDPTVDATTDGTGPVAELTLAELQELDAGWSFEDESGAHPFRGSGVRIPTVEEVLTAFPDVLTSVEFKVAGEAPDRLCDMLRRLGRADDVYVSSAGDAAVDRFRAVCPEMITTVTDALVVDMRAARESGAQWCSPVPIGQPPFAADRSRPNRASVQWAHDHGLATFTWTVDDPDDLAYLADIGVDAVYTRRPDIARAVVDGTG